MEASRATGYWQEEHEPTTVSLTIDSTGGEWIGNATLVHY